MDNIPFEDQNPGDVRYGSFSVDELEAMGIGVALHAHVQFLQNLQKARNEIWKYISALNKYAGTILRNKTSYTEYDLRSAVCMDLAADLLRDIKESRTPNMPEKYPSAICIARHLKQYALFVSDHPHDHPAGKAETLDMSVRLLQEALGEVV